MMSYKGMYIANVHFLCTKSILTDFCKVSGRSYILPAVLHNNSREPLPICRSTQTAMSNTGSTSPQRPLINVPTTSICILNHLAREVATKSDKIRPNSNITNRVAGESTHNSRTLQHKIESHAHGIDTGHSGNDVSAEFSA